MNREIKFRGKNSKDEWVIGDLLRNRGETFIAPDGIANPIATADDFKVDPNTVGQFTGIKDNNGMDIYEDDIVNCFNRNGKVIWGFFMPYLIKCWIAECKTGSSLIEVYDDNISEYSEVIGNIYDNPELLK